MLDLAAHRKDWLVAFAAAIVLLLQTTLSTWSATASLQNPMLDAFGSPLCITSSEAPGNQAPDPADGHSSTSMCCTLGCGMSSIAPLEPTGGSIAIRFERSESVAVPAKRRIYRSLVPVYTTGSPRSPPLTA